MVLPPWCKRKFIRYRYWEPDDRGDEAGMNPNAASVIALSQGPEKQLHEPNAPEKDWGAGQEEHLEVPGPHARSHGVPEGQKLQGPEEMQDQEKHQGQGEKSGQQEPGEKEKPEPGEEKPEPGEEKPEPGEKPGQEKPQGPEEKQKSQWQEEKKQGPEEKPGQEQSQEETPGQQQSQEERPGQQQSPEERPELSAETGDPEPPKKRLRRITFTRSQVNVLESVFQTTQYPDSVLRRELAVRIDVPETRVQVWFKNRRVKWRKQQKEEDTCTNGAPVAPNPPVGLTLNGRSNAFVVLQSDCRWVLLEPRSPELRMLPRPPNSLRVPMSTRPPLHMCPSHLASFGLERAPIIRSNFLVPVTLPNVCFP